MGDGHGRVGAMPHQVRMEIEANGEHIQEHAQLRDDAQKGATVWGRRIAEASAPRNDGPSTMPAITSPMTGGCPR